MSNYIAQSRVGDCATVRVLSINPNAELICDRECSCLKESKNGSFRCSVDRIKNMVDFKASALIIDYEVFLDRKTNWDWTVLASDFPIIDEEGDIYEGKLICEDFISPEQFKNCPRTLFPGTRGRYRVYYESFPKDGKIASIMALADNGSKARMDLLNPEPEQDVAIEQTQPMIIAPNQENDSKSVETPKPDKGKIGCFTTAVIIISSFIVAGPLAFFSIEYFIESGNEFGLFVGIFFIVIGTVVAILLFKHQKSDSNTASSLSKPDSGLSLDATASAIMMGLWLGGKKDRDSESDSLRDTFLWQEKYHKDRY